MNASAPCKTSASAPRAVFAIAVFGKPAPMRVVVAVVAIERAGAIHRNDVAHARLPAAS